LGEEFCEKIGERDNHGQADEGGNKEGLGMDMKEIALDQDHQQEKGTQKDH